MDISSEAACTCCQSRRSMRIHHGMETRKGFKTMRRNTFPRGMDSYIIWILTISLCLLQGYATVAPPFITRHPEGDVTIQGNTEVLRCYAIGSPPLQYRWWKDGAQVQEAQTSNYRLASITQTQAGEYRCLVENPVGTIMSKAADIRVAYMGSFPSAGSSQLIMAGKATIIDCPPIESYPPPAISWYKDGNFLIADGRIVMALDGRLVITDTMSSDAGEYKCHAENTISGYFHDSQPIIFTVTSPSTPAVAISPSIIIPPQDVIVHEGEPLAEMECIINARPLEDLEITWVRGGEVYRTGGSELFKLQIRNPMMSDQGTYECQATLNGVTVTASANLTYYTMPTFMVSPDSSTVSPVGSTVVIPCQATGIPTPSVEWFRNAVDVTTMGDSRYEILSTGSLQIRDLQKPDGAMLQCRIVNEVGEDIKDTQLIVKEIAPEFTIYPNDTLLLVGESAFLECQASGAPVPTIQWFKDGAVVASESSTVSSRYIFESGNLRINNAVTTDSGVFMCQATNTKGSINVTLNFNVYEQTYISTRPVDTEEVLSRTTTLECIVYSDSRIAPSIVWYHDNQEVDITNNRITVHQSGSLEIRRVSANDAGSYECQVSSVAGNDRATAQLSVIQLPYPPDTLQARISPTDSRTIILTWVAPFNGNTQLLRYIIDQKEDLSSYREIESTVDPTVTRFDVVGVKPSRTYQFRIRAENKVGVGENSEPSTAVSLPEEPPDDPPQRVVASASSIDSINVEWQEPPEDSWNGDLKGYIVRHRLYGYPNDWTPMNVSNVRQTSVVVAGLLTWQRYEIQVAGYNNAGVGTFSDSAKERTLEGVPSDPPRSVVIEVINSTAISFTWSPPSPVSINGINQGYKLHLWEPGMEDDKTEVVIPNMPGVTSYSEHVGGLKKYTEYITTVLCYTNPGNGPASTPRTLRTHEDVPGPVVNLRVTNVQAMSLTLEWDPPAEENGVLTKYFVRYFPVNDSSAVVVSEREPDTTHLHVTRLNAETTYSFSVWAETSVGEGLMQTTIIKSGIAPEKPHAPTTLAVSNVQSRSVFLQFTPGNDGHASISLWTVEALVGASTKWEVVFTINDPGSNGFDVTGLRPYTDYTFRMMATNVAGDSPPSDESNSIKTLPNVPEIAPNEVNVRAYDEHSLRVRWVPLVETEWNGVARGYMVIWSKHDDPEAQPERHFFIDDPYGSEYIITGLEEYTGYKVILRAINTIGEGPRSPPNIQWTHETVPSAGPTEVTASALDHSSIQVIWGDIPQQDRNGIIVGYTVLYRESSSSMSTQMVQGVEGNKTRETTLTGLKGFTGYNIMVLGSTRVGDGTPSDTITATTLESVPGAPTNIQFPTVTETSVLIQWSEPSEPNGIIVDYEVTYKIRGESQIINTHVTDNSAVNEYRVSDLQGNTYYAFTVRARNRLGWGDPETSEVFTTSQRDAPDKPTNVNVNRVRSRQASLSWTPGSPNNAPIRSYRIRLRNTGGSWMDHPSSIPHNALSYTITGLKPYTDYQFKIQAMNDVGSSPFSDPSSYIKTVEDEPEGAPSIVNVKPFTTTSVAITWQAPPSETHNGDLLGYKVVFRQLPGGILRERIIDDPDATSYSLVDLSKYEDYEVKLAAFNSIGAGPFSRPWTVFVGEAAPSAPPSSVGIHTSGANSVRITWSPPPEDSLNGGLQGYKVLYWPMSKKREAEVFTRTYPTASTDVVLDGLKCATTYAIQVKGFNAAGDGPPSEIQTTMTDEDVPGEVAFLEFAKVRMTSLVVSWGVPPESCGNITFYKLSYHPLQTVNGEKSSITKEISASKTSDHVMELDPEVLYSFTISARTYSKAQYGPVIEKNITTGPQPGAPNMPRSVEIELDGEYLFLYWEEPESGGYSPVTNYFIEYQEEGQKEWILLVDNIPSSDRYYSFLFQELKSSTVYSFRVSAENAESASVPGYLPQTFDTSGIHYTGAQAAFYEEWWFLVIVALVGVIIIILVCATLCMLGRSKLYKEKKKGKRVNHVHHPTTTDDTAFQPMELNQTRRGPRNGNYTSTNSYRRPPPKPSPGSVQYSEEEESKHYEPVTTREVGETASLTDRYPESVGSESEPELRDEAADSFVNHYASLPSNQNWRQQAAPQAYSYTDSEPDHNSVAMYNNGLVNMEAGSRNPIQGFSSFV